MKLDIKKIKWTSKASILIIIGTLYALWYLSFFVNMFLFVAIDGQLYSIMNDDAMISMRYAWNLANGNGLVWNSGEYVQGYSNLLMTLFMTLIHLVFDQRHAVMAVNMSGLVFMLTIAYGASMIASYVCHNGASSRDRDVASIMAFALVLCYHPLSHWSIMGMETGMLTMLVTLGVLFAFRYEHGREPKHLYLATLLFSLALLTRTETVLISTPVGLYVISLLLRTGHRQHACHVLVAVIAYIATGIGLLLFQHSYYGEWLPNTYTLKLVGIPLQFRMLDGIRYIIPFLWNILVIVVCVAADMIRGYSRRKTLMCCIVVTMILYNIYIGGDVYGYYRIVMPAMPLLLVLFAVSMVRTMDIEKLWPTKSDQGVNGAELIRMKLHFAAMAGLLLSATLALNLQYLREIAMVYRLPYTGGYRLFTNRALLLDKFLSAQATIGVGAAGVVGYYTNRVGIDFWGKMDRHVANLPPDLTGNAAMFSSRSMVGHNKYDLEYSIKQKRPVHIEWFAHGQDDLSEWAKQHYVAIRIPGNNDYYGLPLVMHDLFLLEGSPHVDWKLLRREGYAVMKWSTQWY